MTHAFVHNLTSLKRTGSQQHDLNNISTNPSHKLYT